MKSTMGGGAGVASARAAGEGRQPVRWGRGRLKESRGGSRPTQPRSKASASAPLRDPHRLIAISLHRHRSCQPPRSCTCAPLAGRAPIHYAPLSLCTAPLRSLSPSAILDVEFSWRFGLYGFSGKGECLSTGFSITLVLLSLGTVRFPFLVSFLFPVGASFLRIL